MAGGYRPIPFGVWPRDNSEQANCRQGEVQESDLS